MFDSLKKRWEMDKQYSDLCFEFFNRARPAIDFKIAEDLDCDLEKAALLLAMQKQVEQSENLQAWQDITFDLIDLTAAKKMLFTDVSEKAAGFLIKASGVEASAAFIPEKYRFPEYVALANSAKQQSMKTLIAETCLNKPLFE